MRIRWTKPAADDLTQISDYTEENFGPSQARRAATTIYEAVDSLAKFPRRGRPGKKPETRELVISELPFLVVYRNSGSVIEVMRILHGSRKWP
jgi:toxin ParE1/3/4